MPGRKHPKMMFEGYCYLVHSRGFGKTRWRCPNAPQTKCGATLFTFGKTVEVTHGHNHARPRISTEQKTIYIENPKPGKHPKLIVDNNLFLRHRTQATKTGITIRWRCFNVFKTKCKAVLYTTLQEGTAIKVLYDHNHDANIDKWDKMKMIARRFLIQRPTQACKRGPVKLDKLPKKRKSVQREQPPEENNLEVNVRAEREMSFHVAGQEQPILIKLLDDPGIPK